MSIRHKSIALGAVLAALAAPAPYAVAAVSGDFDWEPQSLSLKLYRDSLAFETMEAPQSSQAPRGAAGRAADPSTLERESGDAAFMRWIELLQQQMSIQNALDK